MKVHVTHYFLNTFDIFAVLLFIMNRDEDRKSLIRTQYIGLLVYSIVYRNLFIFPSIV
jgi:hypothetical protein